MPQDAAWPCAVRTKQARVRWCGGKCQGCVELPRPAGPAAHRDQHFAEDRRPGGRDERLAGTPERSLPGMAPTQKLPERLPAVRGGLPTEGVGAGLTGPRGAAHAAPLPWVCQARGSTARDGQKPQRPASERPRLGRCAVPGAVLTVPAASPSPALWGVRPRTWRGIRTAGKAGGELPEGGGSEPRGPCKVPSRALSNRTIRHVRSARTLGPPGQVSATPAHG